MHTDNRQKFLIELDGHHGKIGAALSAAGLRSRNTYYKWRTADPEFAQRCDAIISRYAHAPKARCQERPAPAASHSGEASTVKVEPTPVAKVAPHEARSTWQEFADEARCDIEEALDARGIDKAGLLPQINTAVSLVADMRMIDKQLAEDSLTITEISREGDIRVKLNPLLETKRKIADSLTAIYKALGLNLNATVPARQTDDMTELLKVMSNDRRG